jgi:hypothetical protein
MKKFKNSLLTATAFSLLTVTVLQCKKEPLSSTKANLNALNVFVPQNEGDAKVKVLSVVNTLETSGTQVRTETPDMPVNEARWVLEASGNYLWNHNITGRKTTKVLGLKVELANESLSGQLSIDGTELNSKFADIAQKLNSGFESGQVLGGIDVTIDAVKPEKTELTVRAIVMAPQTLNCANLGIQSDPSFTTSDLSYIATYTGVCVNENIPNIVLNAGCLFSDLFI